MRVLMVASEAAPFAKTGGLADVLNALPLALARLGHAVDVLIPRYRGITEGTRARSLRVTMGAETRDADVYASAGDGGVRTLFLDQPDYYDRDALYGTPSADYPDNAARFAFLSYAALALAATEESPYAIVHAHDWQGGLLPLLLERRLGDAATLTPPATVLTIHNLAYQGNFDPSWLPRIGLGPEVFHIDALEYWGRISFLKAGVRFAHLLTTVSPRYAAEIQTPEFGCGFDGLLRQRTGDLVGILNGIDYDQWDPAADVHLPEPFRASNVEGKAAAKAAVLARLGLPAGRMGVPLVAMISRLVDQKGFDLVAAAADDLTALGATFAVLGTGEARYEALWRTLAARYPDRVGVHIGFDDGLAHLIEGGADIFLMPSRFEPCGLNQMYSLRYGTVPVVRAVGGLFDTVRDVDPRTGEGNGFTFHEYTPAALVGALQRALAAYANRRRWRRIQQAGMQADHSWDASARAYVAAYERATRRRGAGGQPA